MTLTPLVSIWSAIVWNRWVEPSAFWMSYWTPAALTACSRYGRSKLSHGVDDVVSGRIPPPLPFTAELDEPLEPFESSDPPPHAERVTAAAAVRAVRQTIPLRRTVSLATSADVFLRTPTPKGWEARLRLATGFAEL